MAGQPPEHAVPPDASGEQVERAREIPPEVVEAVREHPEDVARLLDRLGLLNGLLDAASVAVAGADDEMVQRLTRTGANLGAVADGMATPEAADLGTAVGDNAAALADGVETVAALQRDGTLDTLAELGDVVALASAALDDEMVTTLAATGSRLGEVADTAADEDTARGIEAMLTAVGDASAETAEPTGALGMVRAMRDPEVKAGMGYLLALARALGRETGPAQP